MISGVCHPQEAPAVQGNPLRVIELGGGSVSIGTARLAVPGQGFDGLACTQRNASNDMVFTVGQIQAASRPIDNHGARSLEARFQPSRIHETRHPLPSGVDFRGFGQGLGLQDRLIHRAAEEETASWILRDSFDTESGGARLNVHYSDCRNCQDASNLSSQGRKAGFRTLDPALIIDRTAASSRLRNWTGMSCRTCPLLSITTGESLS